MYQAFIHCIKLSSTFPNAANRHRFFFPSPSSRAAAPECRPAHGWTQMRKARRRSKKFQVQSDVPPLKSKECPLKIDDFCRWYIYIYMLNYVKLWFPFKMVPFQVTFLPCRGCKINFPSPPKKNRVDPYLMESSPCRRGPSGICDRNRRKVVKLDDFPRYGYPTEN